MKEECASGDLGISKGTIVKSSEYCPLRNISCSDHYVFPFSHSAPQDKNKPPWYDCSFLYVCENSTTFRNLISSEKWAVVLTSKVLLNMHIYIYFYPFTGFARSPWPWEIMKWGDDSARWRSPGIMSPTYRTHCSIVAWKMLCEPIEKLGKDWMGTKADSSYISQCCLRREMSSRWTLQPQMIP